MCLEFLRVPEPDTRRRISFFHTHKIKMEEIPRKKKTCRLFSSFFKKERKEEKVYESNRDCERSSIIFIHR
jgi:hypothetical protein